MANLSTMSLPSLRVFQGDRTPLGSKTPIALNLSKRSNAMGLHSGTQPLHPFHSQVNRQDTVTLRFGAADALKFQPSLNPLLKAETSQDAFKKTLNAQLQKVLAQGDATPAFKAEKVALTHQLTEVLDQYLQGIWTDETQPAKKAEALEALKALMGPRGQGNVVMAQINPAPGDLEGNARKIMAYLDMAEKIGVDSVFFPEMSLMGYPIRDIIKRHPFIVKENLKWLQAIAKRTGKTKAYIGFVEPRELPKTAKPTEKPSGKEFYNSVAILGDGKLEGLVRKSLLPTYGEFNDDRTFEASDVTGMLSPDVLGTITPRNTRPEESGKPHTIHGKKWAPFICEDTWNDKDFMSRPYYENDPIEALMQHKPDVLVNLSASPTRSRKEQMKHAMLSYIAEKHQVPYVYVNQVGSIDETSFEGASRVYDQTGQLVARSKSFQEQFMVVNPFKAEGVINPLPIGLEKTLGARKVFNPYDESDLGRTYLTLIQGIRDYFRKNGGFTKAVLGISGGLDSAVVATLLVDALGSENVIGYSMPYGPITQSSSKKDAVDLAQNLGIQLIEVPITNAVDTVWSTIQSGLSQLNPDWKRFDVKKQAGFENIQARIRSILLWANSNALEKTFCVATSDKSELYLGYTTINGDMSGAFSPISDVPKTKVRLLAKWMNENRATKNAIPTTTITKPSGAELKLDEKTGLPVTAESDNMPYEFEDEIIWRIENFGQSKAQMLSEPFFWESKALVTPEQKKQWVDKFYGKMAASIYKWWISPPTVIVEGNGTITKTEYHHPITANRINWDGHSPERIAQILNETAPTTPVTVAP